MSAPDYFAVAYPRSRKQRACCECTYIIQPGEQYERIAGVWDGVWGHYVTCWTCAGQRQALYDDGNYDPHEGIILGGLDEAMHEADRELYVREVGQ